MFRERDSESMVRRILLCICILIAAIGGVFLLQKKESIDTGEKEINSNTVQEEMIFPDTVQEETISSSTVSTELEEPEHQILLIKDYNIVLNDLFVQFIAGDINAYSYGEEKFISDYYEKYSRCEINTVHIMAEDLNGDEENELLIDINYAYADGIILVFHCQDGDLFEWESVEYGMHSPTVTLYTDVDMIEITGTRWTRIFYAYNPQGGLQQIFGCASFGEDLEDGSFRRQYSITVYQDGIAKDKYFMEEVFDENDNVVFESSEEEILLFNNVLNDFLSILGEGKQINSTQNDEEATDAVTLDDLINGIDVL